VFNLRFKYVVLRSTFKMLRMLPKANQMIANKEKYGVMERFRYAQDIMNCVKKNSRTTTEVYGRNNIPENETCIFYANHQGKYDAIGILVELDEPCGVLWEERQAKKILGRQVCGLIDGVAINLTNIKKMAEAIFKVSDLVSKGKNFLIFPEGGYTDKTHNSLQEFKTGCFSCSIKSKTTVVPTVIYDSYKAMNSNSLRKVKTQVHFLKPIRYSEYEGMNRSSLSEMVKSRIEEKLNSIKMVENDK